MANIVLVGDDSDLTKLYEDVLEHDDEHSVLTTRSLHEALRLLGKSTQLPEVIVSSVEVDEAAELSFVEALKGNERMADISVFMISDTYSDSHAKELDELGARLLDRNDPIYALRTAVDYELSAKSGILSMMR